MWGKLNNIDALKVVQNYIVNLDLHVCCQPQKYYIYICPGLCTERGLAAAHDGSGRMGGLAAADMGGQLQPFY